MLTWAGRVATQAMASATSSAESGSGTPSYTASAAAWSPPKRTRANSSVWTMPGATSLTRIGSPLSSRRRVWVTALVACLAAV